MKRISLRSHSGFTLKEMLVVLSTILVLMALLIPSLNGARKIAQRAQCLSNLRQLGYSFTASAYDHNGRTLNNVPNGGTFWATSLVPYSSRIDTAAPQQVLLSAICPSATSLSRGIGTSSLSWGPNNSYHAPGDSALTVGNQYGSYAINGWLYSNNPAPGMVSSLTHPVGVIANTIGTSGNHSIYGDAIGVTSISMGGASTISGNATSGGSIGGSIGGTKSPNVDPTTIPIPDVDAIYNALAATPGIQVLNSVSGNMTIDFTLHSVIQVTGNADFSNVTFIGSGTILVAGSVSAIPSSTADALNIVTLGTVDLKNGSMSGSIYAKGNVTGNGHGRINGNVVTEGTYGGNGGPDIYAAPFPSFDTTYDRPGFVNSINSAMANASRIPVFGDAIWAEAWPAVGDPLPTNLDTGDINSNLGRYYIARHNKAINIVFLDGHAETVSLPRVPLLKWSEQFPNQF